MAVVDVPLARMGIGCYRVVRFFKIVSYALHENTAYLKLC